MGIWDNLCQALKEMLISEGGDKHSGFWPDEVILEHAKRDWVMAMRIFEDASHPELIEYAVYNLKAAEKRYMYLLKQLRSESGAAVPVPYRRVNNS